MNFLFCKTRETWLYEFPTIERYPKQRYQVFVPHSTVVRPRTDSFVARQVTLTVAAKGCGELQLGASVA